VSNIEAGGQPGDKARRRVEHQELVTMHVGEWSPAAAPRDQKSTSRQTMVARSPHMCRNGGTGGGDVAREASRLAQAVSASGTSL
jgi:hypothetical protein